MPQSESHERLVQVALDFGWKLWGQGTDSECEIDASSLTPIWMKPCAWDENQMVPVGCLCCTDLERALWDFCGERRHVIESKRQALLEYVQGLGGREAEEEAPERPEPLASSPSWLPFYQAR